MPDDRLLQQYRQYLNWTETKIQRYLLAHRSGDETQLVLALSLALISHRLPFYGKCSAVLEDPRSVLEFLIQTCSEQPASEQDKVSTVSILCSICDEYVALGVSIEKEPMQVLLESAAKIALMISGTGMQQMMVTRCFERTLGRQIDWKLVEMIANGKTKSKKRRV